MASPRLIRKKTLLTAALGVAAIVGTGLAASGPAPEAAAALETKGAAMVDAFLENGPHAMAQTKACALDHAFGRFDKVVMDGLISAHSKKRQSDEAREGLASFAEKRSAKWP